MIGPWLSFQFLRLKFLVEFRKDTLIKIGILLAMGQVANLIFAIGYNRRVVKLLVSKILEHRWFVLIC